MIEKKMNEWIKEIPFHSFQPARSYAGWKEEARLRKEKTVRYCLLPWKHEICQK
jgi:hypothetical protein